MTCFRCSTLDGTELQELFKLVPSLVTGFFYFSTVEDRTTTDPEEWVLLGVVRQVEDDLKKVGENGSLSSGSGKVDSVPEPNTEISVTVLLSSLSSVTESDLLALHIGDKQIFSGMMVGWKGDTFRCLVVVTSDDPLVAQGQHELRVYGKAQAHWFLPLALKTMPSLLAVL